MRIDNPVANGRPCTYIACTNPIYGPREGTRQWVKKQKAGNGRTATGHHAMVTAPAEFARMLAPSVGRVFRRGYPTLLSRPPAYGEPRACQAARHAHAVSHLASGRKAKK
jgi:hypothetical protein